MNPLTICGLAYKGPLILKQTIAVIHSYCWHIFLRHDCFEMHAMQRDVVYNADISADDQTITHALLFAIETRRIHNGKFSEYFEQETWALSELSDGHCDVILRHSACVPLSSTKMPPCICRVPMSASLLFARFSALLEKPRRPKLSHHTQ